MIERIKALLYYLVNCVAFKAIHPTVCIYWPTRVQGKRYISVGRKTAIQRSSWLLAMQVMNEKPTLNIGAFCAIGDQAHITAVRNVTIRDHVLIANRVYISDNAHEYQDIHVPIKNQPVKFLKEVIIHEGAWIGENVCIIGASVGKNSVVGANSVVTKDIPDYSIAVGMPAKVIKQYNQKTQQWEAI